MNVANIRSYQQSLQNLSLLFHKLYINIIINCQIDKISTMNTHQNISVRHFFLNM